MALNKNHVGLALGIFFALLHAAWALLIGLGVAKEMMDWVFVLHFLNITYATLIFSWGTALILVIVTFIAGYVTGWVYAWLFNLTVKWAKK